MSTFEFVFSLFGLLLGFALVEVLSGLVRATSKPGHSARQLYLTSALGLLVALDLITFWTVLFWARETIPANTLTLYVGFAVSAVYYWAASMIFPDTAQPSVGLDAHYFAVRRRVIAAILLCNFATYSAIAAASGHLPDGVAITELSIFTLLLGLVMAAKSKRASATALTSVIVAYLAAAVIHAFVLSG